MLPDIIGREADLDAIDAFLHAMVAGFACLVLTGEAGIGKTTLWREALRRAGSLGYQALSCRPAEPEMRLSFAGLADLLGPASDDALETLPVPQRRALDVALLRADDEGSPAEPRAVAAAVRGVLAAMAERSPVLVAIDDVQWLDDPSTGALAFVFRRLEGERVGVLLTRRPVGRGAPDRLPLPLARRVELDRLSLAAIHQLLKGRLGRSLPRPVLVRLYETSRGNPFFALEIAREVVDSGLGPGDPLPVPHDLRQLVRRRLARLPRPAREALLAASALREPTPALLASALDADPTAALEEAEEAGAVEVVAGLIRFTHPLYAAAIYAGASPERRRRLHRRLADVVGDVEERARHLALSASEPDEDVASALEEAAIRARRRGSAEAAAELADHARRRTPPHRLDDADRRTMLVGESLLQAGDRAGSRAVLQSIVSGPRGGVTRARAAIPLAVACWYDDSSLAVQYLERSLEDATDDPLLAGQIHGHLAILCDFDLSKAAHHASRAARLLDRPGHEGELSALLFQQFYLEVVLGKRPRMDRFERALALEAPGTLWESSTVPALWWKYTDRFDEARDRLEATLEQGRELGDQSADPDLLAHLAEVELWAGNWPRARARADEAVEAAEQEGMVSPNIATRARGLVGAHLGEGEESRATLQAGAAAGEERGDAVFAAMNLSALGSLALAEGNPAATDGFLSRAAELLQGTGMVEPLRFRDEPDHIEALTALGEIGRARDVLAKLEERGRHIPRPWIAAALPRCRAMIAGAEGDLGAAAAELAVAREAASAMPFDEGRTLLVLGQVHRRRNERLLARRALDEALALFEGLGARLWADRARAEIRRIGVRRAPSGLTAAELAVADLAARGLTNREIGARLFLARRTVEDNLARVYRKLGIHSRAELGARMAGLEGGPTS